MGLIFGLAAVGMYVEWSWGWLDWIADRGSSRLRASAWTAVFVANVVAAGVLVFIPVQLFAPDDKQDAAE